MPWHHGPTALYAGAAGSMKHTERLVCFLTLNLIEARGDLSAAGSRRLQVLVIINTADRKMIRIRYHISNVLSQIFPNK